MPIKMAPQRLAPSSGGRLHQPTSKQAAPFYVSAEWKAFRNQIIRERGWRCEDPKCETPRGPWKQIYGDHIVELADGGAPFERANVLLRCGVCHGRKTRDARAVRAGLISIAAGAGGG